MALFETTVFAYKVQIAATNNNGVLHFAFANNTGQNAATNFNVASEVAFLVDVGAIYCLTWSFESLANVTVPAKRVLLGEIRLEFAVEINAKLFLECPFVLISHI